MVVFVQFQLLIGAAPARAQQRISRNVGSRRWEPSKARLTCSCACVEAAARVVAVGRFSLPAAAALGDVAAITLLGALLQVGDGGLILPCLFDTLAGSLIGLARGGAPWCCLIRAGRGCWVSTVAFQVTPRFTAVTSEHAAVRYRGATTSTSRPSTCPRPASLRDDQARASSTFAQPSPSKPCSVSHLRTPVNQLPADQASKICRHTNRIDARLATTATFEEEPEPATPRQLPSPSAYWIRR